MTDLRRALGYERWIVRGGSYGTRLAQEVKRTDPLGVHAAVMIAPAPAGRQGEALEWRLSIQHTLEKLFAACAADTACHTAFPDPAGRIRRARRVLHELPPDADTEAGVCHWVAGRPALKTSRTDISRDIDHASRLDLAEVALIALPDRLW